MLYYNISHFEKLFLPLQGESVALRGGGGGCDVTKIVAVLTFFMLDV